MTTEELPIPYTDFLYIEPVENVQLLTKSKQQYGKVLAVGPDVKNTQVGEYVAFELWDKPEFPLANEKICHFVREKDAVCKLPTSWI